MFSCTVLHTISDDTHSCSLCRIGSILFKTVPPVTEMVDLACPLVGVTDLWSVSLTNTTSESDLQRERNTLTSTSGDRAVVGRDHSGLTPRLKCFNCTSKTCGHRSTLELIKGWSRSETDTQWPTTLVMMLYLTFSTYNMYPC